ncbi:hypothetical protein [Cognatiluteimonas weifangensis]|uniref:Protein sip-5 n=1 Tax=Cognatiluteimonas weifangensis TaxID=2303539 RepID=A0A372DI29_9GAMM|nr:hypothetical protein [Luteimonas weifangensis]RFP59186.1 hypothetical protein D0Y53_11385 [Luteimonas weifangensis]
MGFDALIQKVTQAEAALEAQERRTAADWRQLRASWRQAWTPGRIVIAGLVSGFVVGRVELPRNATGGGTLQLLSALAGLFAGGSAQAAAGEAAATAQQAAAATADAAGTEPGPTPAAAAAPATAPELTPEATQDLYRHAGLP